MSALLGKALGINQEKAVQAIIAKVDDLLGGMTLAEWVDKYGNAHQLKFDVSLADSKIQVAGHVWLEPKEKP